MIFRIRGREPEDERDRERKRKLMRDSRESESGCKETWAGDKGKKGS